MMQKKELIAKLTELNVNPRFYSLGYEIKSNAKNIGRLPDGKYSIYSLDERNEKRILKICDTESDAFDELLKLIEESLSYGIDLSGIDKFKR